MSKKLTIYEFSTVIAVRFNPLYQTEIFNFIKELGYSYTNLIRYSISDRCYYFSRTGEKVENNNFIIYSKKSKRFYLSKRNDIIDILYSNY